MSKICFVAKAGLDAFPGILAKLGYEVLVPVEKPATAKPSIIFQPWQEGQSWTLLKATVPPKEAVLPECEVLFDYKQTRDPKDLNERTIGLNAREPAKPVIVFGCRPCDARGFDCLDKPYLQGLFADPYYKVKRDNLIVVSYTCDTGCETCFCHWVGGGPTSPIGADILMTGIEGGYILQSITPKGEELLVKSQAEDGADKFAQAEEVRKGAWKSLVPAPNLKNAPESLKAIFTDDKFWTYWTARCISCGACTYFCPTCYCFNITDEGSSGSSNGGQRLRSWDNCMSSRYTREASGHNPRPIKYERMRNRISHKFWTFFVNWGSFLCSGCGRCITNCPVHLDIREITLAAIDNAATRNQQKAG